MFTWLRAVGVLAALVLAGPAPVLAWGPIVHQTVTERAVDTLPKGLKPFYKNHMLELPSLSPDEEEAGDEGRERRFAIDRLAPFPFAEVPRREADFKEKYGAAGAEIGRLPWMIQDTFARLVEAFRSGDKTRILAESDTLAALVTDLRNPLALTDNSDGQKSGQHGLWVRVAARLPGGMGKALSLNPDAAHLLEDPAGHVFGVINATYVWVDNILYQEELAKRGKGGYGEIYYEALAERAGPILRQHLSAAAGDVGSFWYTAWTQAGRPELK